MRKIVCGALIAGILGTGSAHSQAVGRKHFSATALPRNTRALLDEAMALMDQSYDPQAHLVLHPPEQSQDRGKYMVRESSWYALGLLMRNEPGDNARASAILEAVLVEQYVDPNVKWYGTFKRSPEEPLPDAAAVAFRGYDPNWRHFIGTTFQLILIEFSGRLPPELVSRLYHSIDLAVEGELHDGRLVPSYTNIALMYGALWDFAAVHDNRMDWKKQSAEWTQSVYDLYLPNRAFAEFNAPTYYGVDLYGLALWRSYGSNPHMRQIGAAMESGLWTDVSNFYQPSLRNMAGPYDRAYGMDMSVYVTPTGVWLRTVLDAEHAPLPDKPSLETFQVADTWFAPQIALLGTRIPAPAMKRFQRFSGSHLVQRQIDPQRVATAWLGEQAIWGGESTSLTKDTGNKTQFHPVDVQWRMPSGRIGWIELTKSPNMDAEADAHGVTIVTDGDVSFRVHAEASVNLSRASWDLPGMQVQVEADATDFVKEATDKANNDGVTYKGTKHMRLTFTPAVSPKVVSGKP